MQLAHLLNVIPKRKAEMPSTHAAAGTLVSACSCLKYFQISFSSIPSAGTERLYCKKIAKKIAATQIQRERVHLHPQLPRILLDQSVPGAY